MAAIKISIVNACTVLSDSQIRTAVTDIQTQVHRDFAQAWGIDADLVFVPKGIKPDPTTWWVTVFDNSDVAGALGYHDLTPAGLPLGKVFAKTDMLYGCSWTATMSHEILEMLADPDVNLTVFIQGRTGGKIYAREVCDPCEDDSQGYRIGQTLVSDFVFPAYFEPTVKPGRSQFDQKGLIKKPFQVLVNGYQSIYIIGSGWTYAFAEHPSTPSSKYASRARVGSRREKRSIPADERILSAITDKVLSP